MTAERLIPRFEPFDLDAARQAPGYFYLATPYTRYAAGIEAAFIAASIGAAGLIRLGVAVFSPIAHTHPVGIHGGIDPYDVEFWLKADAALMRAAYGLIVFTLDGWDVSRGVTHEIYEFRMEGKPIAYLAPKQLENALLIQRRQKARPVANLSKLAADLAKFAGEQKEVRDVEIGLMRPVG